jgi:prepilin-type N-terminal cleavage/methylation domain-containing protein
MRRSNAFTLIEVMAAVVLLALFVAAISPMLVQAQGQERDARLRARASALADRLLTEVDEAALRGGTLTSGAHETREENLVATTTIAAFDPASLQPAAKDPERPAREATQAAGWLAGPNAKATPPILEIAIRVSWDGAPVDAESQLPYAVKRRTFVLNPAALEALASSEAGDEGGENDAGDGG